MKCVIIESDQVSFTLLLARQVLFGRRLTQGSNVMMRDIERMSYKTIELGQILMEEGNEICHSIE
jgi:hypothetical protein